MNRRLSVGGDELSIPSLCSIILRTFWCFAIVVMMMEARSDLTDCESTGLVNFYFIASLTCFVLAIGLEMMIFNNSLKGVIADSSVRSKIGHLLMVHMGFGMGQLCLAIIGISLAFLFEPSCANDDKSHLLLRVLLLTLSLSQIVDASVLCCCCILVVGAKTNSLFEPNNDESGNVSFEYELLASENMEKALAERCKWLCQVLSCISCKQFGGHDLEADFAHLARVVARIFHTEDYLDIVPSDVVAGIVLLRSRQRDENKRKEICRLSVMTEDVESGRSVNDIPLQYKNRVMKHNKWWRVGARKVLDMENSEDKRLLDEAAYFSRYALAIYSWYLYIFDHPLCGPCEVCMFGSLNCTRNFHRRQRRRAMAKQNDSFDSEEFELRNCSNKFPIVKGDNCFHTHEAALLKVAGLNDCELAFATFQNDVNLTPYAILIDHERKSIVITIRGTMSFDDCIVDALAEPCSMEACGEKWGFDGKDMHAHKGALDRAKWVRENIKEMGVLKSLTGNDKKEYSPLSNSCRNYDIRVVGHSLGAGIAVLVGYMLQPQYPSVRCLAVSPPGGLIDPSHAKSCKSFVLSVILHNDMVPRLAMKTLEEMRDEILELIGRAKVNKTTVMRSLLKNPKPCLSELAYERDEPRAPTAYDRQLNHFRVWMSQVNTARPNFKLDPPGRLLHLIKTHRKFNRTGTYTPVWSDPDDFNEMVISSSMFTDHWPTRTVPILSETLQELVKEYEEARESMGSNGRRQSAEFLEMCGARKTSGGDFL